MTDNLRISFAFSDRIWFGILADKKDHLVASSLSTSREGLTTHLNMICRTLVGSDPRLVKHPLLDRMLDLFKGNGPGENTRLNEESITSFQRRVHEVLTRIPRGQVTTYGMIAKTIGSGPRAVGGAVASNPWPVFVPCHRVVPSNLNIGNYSMGGSPSRQGSIVKEQLLKREGVPIQQGKVISSSFWKPRGA